MAGMAAQAFPNGDGALALREMNDKTRSADVALRNASEKAPAAAASTRRATCAPRSSTIINATTFVSSRSAAMKSSIACRRESSDRRARISAMVARYNADVILEGGEGARRNERHCCSLRADQFGHARRRSKRFKRPSSAPPRRYGRYNVERLIAAHGADAKLPDLLATLADCPKARSLSVHDRCKAVYQKPLP